MTCGIKAGHLRVLAELGRYDALGQSADFNAIALALDITVGSVRVYVSQLIVAGMIFRAGRGRKNQRRFLLAAPTPKATAPLLATATPSTFIAPPSIKRLMGRRA